MWPHLDKEIALLVQGYSFVAGLDEAGRGAWAGPVVAAAVMLPLHQPDLPQQLAGLNDSKKLTVHQREQLFSPIQQIALGYGIGVISAEAIDATNILAATRQAMMAAIRQLSPTPQYLLLDYVRLSQLNIPQDSFPKADTISLSVAAASILAKVTRDRLMVELHEQYPHYGFDQHKGYGTSLHQQALNEHGPCPIHRLSFKPLQSLALLL